MAVKTLRERQAEATRQLLIDVAREFFTERGYAGTSMSLIATRVGGSKGTLYNYFKSKEELFVAVIERNGAIYCSEE